MGTSKMLAPAWGQGQIEIIDVPTIQKPITISRIPNNLGLIIKSERLLELEKKFKN